ncbi:MAG: sulfite exporter TauE/SafE family protein [Chloroflexi bacterium]|nr:sulfite exporter TauE/SafE family protein [Chloroflexota bacterium]
MLEIFALLLIGFIGGFAGGLLGIGGGAIYIPAMVLLLGEDQHLAQGASLAAIIATAIVGSFAHFRRDNIDVRTVLWVAPVAATAAFGAALLADTLDATTLRRVFAVVGLYFAITMILGALREEPIPQPGTENA